MINVQTGQRVRATMSRAELREHEIRRGVEQGPVPECLKPPVKSAPDAPAATRKER